MQSPSVIAVFEMVRTERVLQWPGITEAGGGHAEADILGKNAREDVHRERRHVWGFMKQLAVLSYDASQ